MAERTSKNMRESQVELTELVLPNDTNQLGNLLGGRLMHWVDIAAAIAAAKHSGRVCVTASVDEMNFLGPVKLGQVVKLYATVNRAFTTSMEVGVRAEVEDLRSGDVRHVSSAYLTFVAINELGHGVPVPEIIPGSNEEVNWHEGALLRRNARLRKRKQILRHEAERAKAAAKSKRSKK